MLTITHDLKTIVETSEKLNEEEKEEFLAELTTLPEDDQEELATVFLEERSLIKILYDNVQQKIEHIKNRQQWDDIIAQEVECLQQLLLQ